MEVIQQILILYIVAGVGFALTKTKVFNDHTIKAMTTITANVGIPALTVVKLLDVEDPTLLPSLMQTILISFVLLFVLLGAAYLIFRKEAQVRRSIFVQMSAFCNCGFMGYPVITAALGATGLMHAIGFNVAYSFVVWTVGVRLFAGRQPGMWKKMINPTLIASIISMVMFALSLRLPTVIHSAFNYLADMTTPLSMLITGSYMTRITRDIAVDKKMWFTCGVRLVLFPLITMALIMFLPIELIQKQTLFITMLMPCGSVMVIQALTYGTEESARLATGGVALSTILSAATIPLLLQLMPLFA